MTDDYYEPLTILSLGMRGVFEGEAFELVGRTCVRGRRDSIWNEWTLRFSDPGSKRHDAPIFLAEGNGLFTLYEEGGISVRFDRLAPGRGLDVGFVVVDRAEATRVATWGEVEGDEVGATYRYADLSSTRDGRPATINVESASLFVGQRVDLNTLGLDGAYAAAGPGAAARAVHLIAAPEVSRPKGVEIWLEVGLEGVLDPCSQRHRVVGMLSRSSADGANRWDEYCLQNTSRGTLTWLSVSDEGHWGIAEPIEAGLVEEDLDQDVVVLAADRYSVLSPPSQARIEWATGHFPWSVQIGDTVHTKELLANRYILTKEWTTDELSWTRAKYVEPDVIAKSFNKRSLPKPKGRAPNQG